MNLAGAVTGIGSLPFADTRAAIDAVARLSPEIPFWPQLPQRAAGESAIAQGLGLLADLIEPRSEGFGYQVKDGCLDRVVALLHRSSGELKAANAAGFAAFEETTFPSAIAVKGQIEGPVTLATYLFHRGRPFLTDPALFAAIAFHVSQMICWQTDRLKLRGLPVLLFIDEPALCLEVPAGRLHAIEVALNDARARGAIAGMHCCAARPFARMCQAKPDILSFDAHEGLEAFFADEDALRFVQDGGTVAYGMVPTWQSLEGVHVAALFTRWLTAASLAGDPQELAQRAMISATCGLGLLDTASVGDSFRIAHDVGALIKQLGRS